MGYASTAHNRTVYASPPVGGSGFQSARSFRYAPFPRLLPPTFLQSLETCGFQGLQKRHIQPERYVQLPLKFVENYIIKMFYRHIDKKYKQNKINKRG
jgi:hypothetical protein